MKNIQNERARVRHSVYGLLIILAIAALAVFFYKKMHPVVLFVSKFPEMWYPRDRAALQEKIRLLLDQAHQQSPGEFEMRPWLLFVPHAGYDYAGSVTAAGYQTLCGAHGKEVKRVIILSPSHYVDFNGMALPSFTHYQTPLGAVSVDRNAVNNLQREQCAGVDDLVFHREHAVDVQIPWIQTCMPNAAIVPLVVGRLPDPEMVKLLAAALVRFVDHSTVVIVSTDLVHYGKRFNFAPFIGRASIQKDIQRLELGVMNTIVGLDRHHFENKLDETAAAVCGKNVIRIALEMAQQGWTSAGSHMVALRDQSDVQILAHDTSASIRKVSFDAPEEYETVGYGAIAAFLRVP